MTTIHRIGRQSGFSSIELMITLGVLIILLALAFTIGRFLNQQTGSLKNAIWHAQLVERAVQAYDPQNNCQGVSAANLVNLKAVPEDMLQGGQIIDAWGNLVQAAAATTVVANDTLIVTYSAVSADDCASFAQQIEGKHFRLDVNGTTVKNTSAAQNYTVGSVATACSGAGAKAFNTYTRCR